MAIASSFLRRLLWNVATVCLAAIKLCYCADMVSVTSTSRKSRPLCTAEVDSTELADVRADCTYSDIIKAGFICDIIQQ